VAADPFTQDALLVQQCVVRLLFALRAMADARGEELTRPDPEERMHIHERNTEKKRSTALMLKSPMKVYRAFGEIGKEVFADGALSKKHKELTALAVAVSQNCFD